MGSRGYSFPRMFEAMRARDWSHAKVELDISQRLQKVYGALSGEAGTVYAPLGGCHIACNDTALATECQQLVRQGAWGQFDQDEFAAAVARLQAAGVVRQDLSSMDATLGGVLLGPTAQGEMIELLRANEMFSNAGAREITLPTNGRLQFPRTTGGGTAYWVGEARTITGSDVTTGSLVMQAKKLAALCNLPNELMRFVTPTIEQFIRTEIARTLAIELDVSLMTSPGSALRPKGLLNYSIQSVTASTVGADGDTFEPEDIELMVAKVEEANVSSDGFTFIARPSLVAGIKTRRGDAVSAGDKKGPRIFTVEPNGNVGGYRWVKSTSIPNNITKGSGTALTRVVGGVFNQYLIGRVGVMEFSMDPYAGPSGTNFVSDMTSLRAIMHVDGMPRREDAFVTCTSLVNK